MNNIYILGSHVYKLKSENSDLLAVLDKLLPAYKNHENTQEEVFDLDGPLAIRGLDKSLFAKDDPLIALVSLLDRALADHAGYLWIDASTMLTPQGQLVLIAGPSHSGKTTLTLAMALAHAWKILAEDITLIDLQTGLLVPFARPLSLRPDTTEKIKQATGLDAGSFILEGWLSNKDWYSLQPVQADFHLAIDLAVTDKSSSESLKIKQVPIGEFSRNLITHSNALRYDNGVKILSESFDHARLYLLSEGSPKDRIKSILELLLE